jgi:hypothetical protein
VLGAAQLALIFARLQMEASDGDDGERNTPWILFSGHNLSIPCCWI